MAILHLKKKATLGTQRKSESKYEAAAEAFARRPFACCCCRLLLFRLMLLLLLLSASQLRHRFVVVFVCVRKVFVFFLATFLGLCVLVKVIMSSSLLFTVSQFAIVVAVAAVNC